MCYILIVVVVVIGNIMVCLVIFINKNLCKMFINVFIFFLVLLDFFIVILVMLFDIEGFFLGWVWNYGEVICRVWIMVYFIIVLILILIFLVVSLDCYKSFSDFFNCYCCLGFMIYKRVIVISLVIWFYSILFVLFFIMGW